MTTSDLQRPRRTAAITGASRGIGRAAAIRLARDGFDVFLAARDAAALEEVAALCRCYGVRAEWATANMERRDEGDQLARRIADFAPRLDCLVLNAGAAFLSPLDASGAQAFDRLMEINLAAPVRLARALIPRMVRGGRLIAVASVLGRFGAPALHGYCASKAGLVGLVRSLALDHVRDGIAVNAVLPGWVDTDMAAGGIAAQAPGMGMDPESARAFFESNVPLKRFLKPDEIAGLIGYLAGEASEGLTGQAINLCGGVMA